MGLAEELKKQNRAFTEEENTERKADRIIAKLTEEITEVNKSGRTYFSVSLHYLKESEPYYVGTNFTDGIKIIKEHFEKEGFKVTMVDHTTCMNMSLDW